MALVIECLGDVLTPAKIEEVVSALFGTGDEPAEECSLTEGYFLDALVSKAEFTSFLYKNLTNSDNKASTAILSVEENSSGEFGLQVRFLAQVPAIDIPSGVSTVQSAAH
jgi:hypothetical protein